MSVKLTPIPQLPDREPTDHETLLLQLLRERDECIQQLSDENARLKGEKGRPKIKPSRLEPKGKAPEEEGASQDEDDKLLTEKKKRPGSQKRKKTANLHIHETQVIEPIAEIPLGSEFKGNPRFHGSRLDYQTPQHQISPSHLENANGGVPEGTITTPGERERTLWSDSEELLTLPTLSLSRYTTVTS